MDRITPRSVPSAIEVLHQFLRGLVVWLGVVLAPSPATQSIIAQDQAESPSSLSGLSVSQGSDVADDQPLDLNDEILNRLLYRVAKVSNQNFEKYCEYSSDLSLAEVFANPRTCRFWVFNLRGRVVSLSKLSIPDADPDGLADCYQVDVRAKSGELIRLIARSIPKIWSAQNALNQPVQCYAFFYGNVSDVANDNPIGLFLTNRIAWMPTEENKELSIGPAQVLLAGKGVDIGLLDFVRQQNTKPLNASDRDCFFQILSASRNITDSDMPGSDLGFVNLMQAPMGHFADNVVVEGRVRRCVPVQIDDERVQKQIGLTHYYELDMFIPLGDQKIVVKNGPESSLEYRQRFPVTVCIAELPDGLKVDDIQDKIVSVRGFFYRFWKYQSEFTDQAVQPTGQVSPLIIGLSPTVLSPPAFVLDNFVMACLLVLIAVVFALLWIFRAPTRSLATGKSGPYKQIPETVDFSNVDSE